jgi:predicted extracellular nuclease
VFEIHRRQLLGTSGVLGAATALGLAVLPTAAPGGPAGAADLRDGCAVARTCRYAAAADIAEIQGAGHLSPLADTDVSGVAGVVTARTPNGFFMQDPRGSSAPGYVHGASSGIFVYTSSAPDAGLVPGTSVSVGGEVREYRPGEAGLTVTEIASPTVTTLAAGQHLPMTTVVGRGGRPVPATVMDDDAGNGPPLDLETQGDFNPVHDGIDFWESLEGMRARINGARVVGPTNATYGETVIVPAGSGLQSARGGIVLQRSDPNPERVVLDDSLGVDVPVADVGDAYQGATVGIVSYAFDSFHLEATSTPTLHHGGIRRESAPTARPGELSVATFNVENLSPANPSAKFTRLAHVVTHALRSPDLLALEEVQDNSGSADDGTVAANLTLRRLVRAIAAHDGPTYRWQQIDPVDDAEGGEPGGNIRIAFLVKTGTPLRFVRRDPGDSTTGTAVTQVDGQVALTHSPGRVSPRNPAWDSTRVPLAGELTYGRHRLFVVANHWSSKGGDNPLEGPVQPPRQPSEVKRTAQARVVAHFVRSILAADPHARVVVLGDLNDFEFSRSVRTLRRDVDPRLVDLPATLPLRRRYTYVYQGNSQVLDHVLITRALASDGFRYDVVHVNAEFSNQVSDHDPQVVDLDLGSP